MRRIPEHLHFISAVRRRLVLVRAGENLCQCCLGATAVLLLLLPWMIWQDRPVDGVLIFAGSASAVAAVLWTIHRWPSQLAAACEADRQFHWADLLSSCLMMDRSADPALAATVRAMADQRCRSTSPSALVLRRFGVRRWGLAGLSLTLVLSLLAFGPELSQASGNRGGGSTDPIARLAEEAPQIFQNPVMPNVSPRLSLRDAPNDMGSTAAINQPVEKDAPPAGNAASSSDVSSASSSNGSGAGQSRSEAVPSALPQTAQSDAGAPSRTNNPAAPTGDGGFSDNPSTADGISHGNGIAGHDSMRVVPPWQTSAWPDAQSHAEQSLRAGHVPDEARDVMRMYFDLNAPR